MKPHELELSETLTKFLHLRGHLTSTDNDEIVTSKSVRKMFPDLVYYIHTLEKMVIEQDIELKKRGGNK